MRWKSATKRATAASRVGDSSSNVGDSSLRHRRQRLKRRRIIRTDGERTRRHRPAVRRFTATTHQCPSDSLPSAGNAVNFRLCKIFAKVQGMATKLSLFFLHVFRPADDVFLPFSFSLLFLAIACNVANLLQVDGGPRSWPARARRQTHAPDTPALSSCQCSARL